MTVPLMGIPGGQGIGKSHREPHDLLFLLRGQWTHPLSSQSQHTLGPLGEPFSGIVAEQNLVFAALRTLSDSYRTVLHLFYFEDLTTARIAEVLDLSVATVKMRLSRGRAMMRDRLTGGLFDE